MKYADYLNHVTVGTGFPVTLATRRIVPFSLTFCSSNRSTNKGACGPGTPRQDTLTWLKGCQRILSELKQSEYFSKINNDINVTGFRFVFYLNYRYLVNTICKCVLLLNLT